jgi:hypothetical protein
MRVYRKVEEEEEEEGGIDIEYLFTKETSELEEEPAPTPGKPFYSPPRSSLLPS